MLHFRIIPRWLLATSCVVMCLISTSAHAQNTTKPTETSLPEASGIIDAYLAARQWVNTFSAPSINDSASQLPIENASGVCVILRRSGRVLGNAVDNSDDLLVVRRAAGRAMAEALGDPIFANIAQQLQSSDSIDSVRASLGKTLILELEVAGQPSPLIGRNLSSIASKLEPGLDGVAIRNNNEWHILFPSQLRIINTTRNPEQVLIQLATKAGVPLNELTEIPQRTDIDFYRFRTVHLTQHEPHRPPIQTFRGDTILSDTHVTRESLVEFAHNLAAHIIESLWPDPPSGTERNPLGIMGDYHPISDQYRPLVAPPRDQALAAFALARFAQSSIANPDAAEAAQHTSITILRDLAVVNDGEVDPTADPTAAAAIHFAVTEWKYGTRLNIQDLQVNALRILDLESTQLVPHEQAMVLGALRREPSHPDKQEEKLISQAFRKTLDQLWQSIPPHEHISLLPWIGWAEEAYADATDSPLQHAEELKNIVTLLDAARVDDGSPDLRGGFALRSGESIQTSSAHVDAQSIRPALWYAGALRNPQIIPPEESNAALGRHLQTMRFIMQLSVRDSARHTLRNPKRALGGIRAATWDSTQPVPAQALALLTLIETIKTIDELQ